MDIKRLLLGPALIAPLALFGCNWGTKVPELPKVPEVIRQIPLEDFEHFPPIVTAPEAPRAAPLHPRPHVRPPARPVRHKRPPAPRRVEEAVPDQPLPPQQGPICIFPLNMIPNCTPQVAQ